MYKFHQAARKRIKAIKITRQKKIAQRTGRTVRRITRKSEYYQDKVDRKKTDFAEKKLTQAQIASNIEERERQAEKKGQENKEYFYQDNPNRAFEEYEVTGSVEEALQVLDAGQEKHPEKRYKAAFETFCAKR